MSLGRPQKVQTNEGNKRMTSRMVPPQSNTTVQSPTSQHHNDLIRYIFDSWCKVSQEFLEQSGSESGRGPAVMYYEEQEPNPQLKDFEPFNLDAFWGRRLVQNYQQASTASLS